MNRKPLVVKIILTYTVIFSLIMQHQVSMAIGLGDVFQNVPVPQVLKEIVPGGGGQQKVGDETTSTSSVATVGGCLLGLGGVVAANKAIRKLAKGNKQKETQYLLGAALTGCALAGKLSNSIYSKMSEDAKKKINEDMVNAASTGETITGADPNNANIKYEVSTEEKEFKEVIAGKEKTCKVMRSVVDDQSDKAEPETALVRHCLDVATGKYKPEPITA